MEDRITLSGTGHMCKKKEAMMVEDRRRGRKFLRGTCVDPQILGKDRDQGFGELPRIEKSRFKKRNLDGKDS